MQCNLQCFVSPLPGFHTEVTHDFSCTISFQGPSETSDGKMEPGDLRRPKASRRRKAAAACQAERVCLAESPALTAPRLVWAADCQISVKMLRRQLTGQEEDGYKLHSRRIGISIEARSWSPWNTMIHRIS